MAKQVIYMDYEGTKMCGILLDNGDLICACCGGLFEASERGIEWDIVIEYDEWVDFSNEIADRTDIRTPTTGNIYPWSKEEEQNDD